MSGEINMNEEIIMNEEAAEESAVSDLYEN